MLAKVFRNLAEDAETEEHKVTTQACLQCMEGLLQATVNPSVLGEEVSKWLTQLKETTTALGELKTIMMFQNDKTFLDDWVLKARLSIYK